MHPHGSKAHGEGQQRLRYFLQNGFGTKQVSFLCVSMDSNVDKCVSFVVNKVNVPCVLCIPCRHILNSGASVTPRISVHSWTHSRPTRCCSLQTLGDAEGRRPQGAAHHRGECGGLQQGVPRGPARRRAARRGRRRRRLPPGLVPDAAPPPTPGRPSGAACCRSQTR